MDTQIWTPKMGTQRTADAHANAQRPNGGKIPYQWTMRACRERVRAVRACSVRTCCACVLAAACGLRGGWSAVGSREEHLGRIGYELERGGDRLSRPLLLLT